MIYYYIDDIKAAAKSNDSDGYFYLYDAKRGWVSYGSRRHTCYGS